MPKVEDLIKTKHYCYQPLVTMNLIFIITWKSKLYNCVWTNLIYLIIISVGIIKSFFVKVKQDINSFKTSIYIRFFYFPRGMNELLTIFSFSFSLNNRENMTECIIAFRSKHKSNIL